MKLEVEVKVNLKTEEVTEQVKRAAPLAMRDIVVAIHNQSVKNAKAVGAWDTGHNARSIASEVSGMGTVQQGADADPEKQVSDDKFEGAVYSTSGYGGFLETGTVKMPARPYMKPAMDANFTKDNFSEKMRRHLK